LFVVFVEFILGTLTLITLGISPMIKPWPIIESTKNFDTGLFSITTNRCRSPRTGQEHNFYVIDFPNWVQVIPITADDQIVMVRQYRHGCGQIFFL